MTKYIVITLIILAIYFYWKHQPKTFVSRSTQTSVAPPSSLDKVLDDKIKLLAFERRLLREEGIDDLEKRIAYLERKISEGKETKERLAERKTELEMRRAQLEELKELKKNIDK